MERLSHALKYAKKIESNRDGRSGFIYLITCRDFVKVGIAVNPYERLMQLQVGCPYELHLLAAFKTDQAIKDERKFHAMWKQYEVRGEWFQVPVGELAGVAHAKMIEEVFNP